MLVAYTNLIPSYDVLGLPMPPWLGQFLMALTLALHWSFLSMTAGGAMAYLLPQPSPAVDRKGLSVFLPFSLSMAMTLGIAPLLFVQVLYGNFFYTANILMGYVWLALLVLVLINIYLLFFAYRRIKQGRSVGPIGLVVLLLLAGSALILSSNATLTQNPQAWDTFRSKMGMVPYLADATFWPRWMFAILALLAGGGLFVTIYRRIQLGKQNEPSRQEISISLMISLAALVGLLLCGFWASRSLPEAIRSTLFESAESIFAYAATAAFLIALILVFIARRAVSLPKLILAGGVFFLGLSAIAALRDTLRRIALADHLSLSKLPVHPQWDSFALFAVVFVLGLALVAYLVSISYRTKSQDASLDEARCSGPPKLKT